MGSLLVKLVSLPAAKQKMAPADIVLEAKIAERVLSDLAAVNHLHIGRLRAILLASEQ